MAVTIDGSASVTINSGAILGITSGTTVASTSGTSIDFTGIPSYVKRVTVMFTGVSTNGTSDLIIQLGTGATPTWTITGYRGSVVKTAALLLDTSGFYISSGIAATSILNGSATLCLMDSANNIWVENGAMGYSDGASVALSAGAVTLSAILTSVRITSVGGVNTFDAGSINILYEG
jgi:hypothetical protein